MRVTVLYFAAARERAGVSREELELRASAVLNAVRDGRLRLRIDRQLPLARAADAHRALEARETHGKVLLVP